MNDRRSAPSSKSVKKNDGGPISFSALEKFSENDLDAWKRLSRRLTSFNNELYSSLHTQRRLIYEKLLAALYEGSCRQFEFTDWWRIVDELYSSHPLDPKGSTLWVGGRFNFGQRINSLEFNPFPALYLAGDHESAFCEKFQIDKAGRNGLKDNEIAFNPDRCFTTYRVALKMNRVFDLRNKNSLDKFASLIAGFRVPQEVKKSALALRISKIPLARSSSMIMRSVFHKKWQTLPAQFGLPSNSQILGKMLRDAKYEGILYRSVRTKRLCMAVFTENLEADSYVEVIGETSANVKVKKIDSGFLKWL